MNIRFTFLIIFLFGLFMLNGLLKTNAQTVVIGTVLDEWDKTPVSNAFVVIGKDTVVTDTIGAFVIENRNKSKQLWVLARDYPPQNVAIADSNEYALTILLSQDNDKYVKDKKLKGKELRHVNDFKGEENDTLRFVGLQGRFHAFVYNASNGEALEAVSVYMKESDDGSMTDSAGYFEVLFAGDKQSLTIDVLGYQTIDTVIQDIGDSSPVKIFLQPLDSELDGVIVYARKKKYRNKNNPAVALIRKVIDRKANNRMIADENAKFEVYDKMVLYASNLPRFISRNFALKRIRVMFDNEDTTLIPRRKLIPLFLSETIADHYFDASNYKVGIQQTSEKRMRFASQLIESNNVTSFLDRLYDQIDIYDDKIRVLNNFFLSPIAPAAPNFYKFFIVDTNEQSGRKVVQLRFEPRNTNDFLFEGRIFVTLDPDYAVTRVDMRLPKKTPINWTSGLSINLGFEKQENGKYWQTNSRYMVNFGLFNSKRGVVGLRYIDKSGYTPNPNMPDSVFKVQQIQLEREGDTLHQKDDAFWTLARPLALTYFEQKAYHNLDSLIATKRYRNFIKTLYILGSGHVSTKYVEFGSLYDFISYNPIEGMKFRAGFRNNIKNLDKFLIEAYGAYGTKDKRFKYYAGGTFALNNKYVKGFPVHNILFSYQYDVRSPGQALGFANQERAVDLIRRGDVNRYLYNKLFTVLYTKEFQNRMTINVGYNNWQQEAAGSLYFERANGFNDTIKNLTTNEFSFNWRFSPGERFVQNKRYRTYNQNRAWVFNVKATAGFNNGYSSQTIDYQKIEAKIEKRFFFPPFGQLYAMVNAGYLFGTVPYPYLFIPQANQSFRYSIGSYNLMNYMEFASDKYVSINLDYRMKGFLLSRIPLVKKMYLREVFGFKAIYGGVRNENLPNFNGDLLKFPVDKNGRSIVNSFSNQPYIEASVGVENVIKIMRIDFVRRFTYKDLPLVSTWGIRFSFGFDF